MNYDNLVEAVCYGYNTVPKLNKYLNMSNKKLLYYYVRKYGLENEVKIRPYIKNI